MTLSEYDKISIRVMVVSDDQELIRKLKKTFAKDAKYELVGCVTDFSMVWEKHVKEGHIRVLIIDADIMEKVASEYAPYLYTIAYSVDVKNTIIISGRDASEFNDNEKIILKKIRYYTLMRKPLDTAKLIRKIRPKKEEYKRRENIPVVREALGILGVSWTRKGYIYLQDAICIYITNEKRKFKMYEIYQKVARLNKTDVNHVKKELDRLVSMTVCMPDYNRRRAIFYDIEELAISKPKNKGIYTYDGFPIKLAGTTRSRKIKADGFIRSVGDELLWRKRNQAGEEQ